MKQDPHTSEKSANARAHAHDHGAALGGRVEIILSLLCNAQYGSAYAAILESIPRRLRARVFALVYSVPVAVFGGTTQLVITWLLHVTGSSMAIAWYLFAISLIGCGAMLAMPETAPLKLRRDAAGLTPALI